MPPYNQFFNPTRKSDDVRRAQGAWLLLISLGIFFVSCIVLYAVYVVLRMNGQHGVVAPFSLHPAFIFTTVLLIAVSTCMHLAVMAVRREARVDLLRYLVLAFVLSLIFFAIQSVYMAWLVSEFASDLTPNQSLYGFTFVLAFLHALHVIGGLASLGLVLLGAWRGAYDHESYFSIRFSAMYWHFLDIVWVLMMVAFAIAAILSKIPASANSSASQVRMDGSGFEATLEPNVAGESAPTPSTVPPAVP